MKKPIAFVFLLLPCVLLLTSQAAEPAEAAGARGQAMIEAFLREEAIRLDEQFLDGVSNRQQWEARRPELRRQYFEMLGLWPLPERTPLNAQITGTIERQEGFRVEKLHFQSRPHLYVTGDLFLPRGARPGAKLPAVLYVCGHVDRGRDGNKAPYQHHGMWFATHGFVCLVIDSLQLGEVAGIHHGTYRYNRWWWQARGYAPSAVECWNGVRALDYLQSRPEVDPDRMAVTGISGGGAASFWIAAADERVKVAVPVSGLGDLQDYVGQKTVNGHCDCMFLINTFQWPCTYIAALIAPRPLLFENSGHDPLFPMDGNDRIRARLERLYGFYTKRTEELFDIGITPDGHHDHPELRLMAYRWLAWHLQGSNAPVTEPALPTFDGPQLRAFPDALPADELNSKIDELFVPLATNTLPKTVQEYQSWREDRLAELRRIVFRPLPRKFNSTPGLDLGREPQAGSIVRAPGVTAYWKFFPASGDKSNGEHWFVVLGTDESFDAKPGWLAKIAGDAAVLLVAPQGTGPTRWQDPPPYTIQRSLPLLGQTVDSRRLEDILAVAAQAISDKSGAKWTIAGNGQAGVIAAYAGMALS
ncbi:MAG: alpha/beta hydrolase family protein [Limisphaerales bacterium]